MSAIKIVLLYSAILGTITFAKQKQFPKGFEFGVATSSYQIEGAWNADNKGPNIWDTFTHKHPNMIIGHANGDIACDSYHKLDEDIRMLKELGVNYYRFSISWARVLPTGFTNFINPAGVKYYHNLIDKLLENKITPMVTMFHWDLPEGFQELGGLSNREFVGYFKEYAQFLFKEYGDKVKYWITFNEPLSICQGGYGSVLAAPALNQSGIADYLCGHNLLLAHSEAYHFYYKHFAYYQRGKIGITLNSDWIEPNSTHPEDLLAAQRAMEFQLGWFAHPIFTNAGDYPEVMKKNIKHLSNLQGFAKSRLPEFTWPQVHRLRFSADFFGLNHYSTLMAADPNEKPSASYTPSYLTDMHVEMWQDPNWPRSNIPWLRVVPWGFRKLLNWVKKNYQYPLLYVTENGYADNGTLDDDDRISYHSQYMENLLDAIYEDGVKVWRYTIWSLMDNFEWEYGYSEHFGLYHVNFTVPERTRIPKKSVRFFQKVFREKRLP